MFVFYINIFWLSAVLLLARLVWKRCLQFALESLLHDAIHDMIMTVKGNFCTSLSDYFTFAYFPRGLLFQFDAEYVCNFRYNSGKLLL